jgi:hypothetical protein
VRRSRDDATRPVVGPGASGAACAMNSRPFIWTKTAEQHDQRRFRAVKQRGFVHKPLVGEGCRRGAAV